MICRICGATKSVLYCKRQGQGQGEASYYYCRKCKCIYLGNLPKADDMMNYVNNEYESGSYRRYVEARDMRYEHFNKELKKLVY